MRFSPQCAVDAALTYHANEVATIILTRSADDNERCAPIFERHGFAVISLPAIELRPLDKDACGVRSVGRLGAGCPVALTSSFATELWLDFRETDFRRPDPPYYIVVGDSSAELLRDGDPDVPIRAVASSARELASVDLGEDKRVLFPCSTERRNELPEALRARGIDVIEFPMYSPIAASIDVKRVEEIANDPSSQPVIVAFYSPSAVRSFFDSMGERKINASYAAIGETTAAAIREFASDVIVAPHPDSEALATALAERIGVTKV
jgi:uroporphyrinogen-III synthase